MNGQEKSDPAIVAGRPTNEAQRCGSQPAEPRAGTEGNAGQQSMRRAQDRGSMSQAQDRTRQTAKQRFAVRYPRREPYARIGPVRI